LHMAASSGMTAMADDAVSATKKMRLSRDNDKSGRDMEKVRDELWKTARETLVDRVMRQQQEIDALSSKQTGDSSLDELRETVEKLKLQVAESARQESLLVVRLANKEQEVQELLGQISELKQALNPSSAQLQSMLLDPAVNLLFLQMKREMETCRSQLEQSQKDLAAWKFTPDSQTGKRLMAKCRMLLQENEELGRSVSSGRLAKLEGDIALQKRLIAEMKSSEKETEEFLGDVDEDLEAMQGTVYLLQQELKDAKDRLHKQQIEIEQLRAAAAATASAAAASCNNASAASAANSSELTASSSSSEPAVAARQTSSGSAVSDQKCDVRTGREKAGRSSPNDEDGRCVKKMSVDVTSSSSSGNHRTLDSKDTPEKMDVDDDHHRHHRSSSTNDNASSTGENASFSKHASGSSSRHSNASSSSRTSPLRHSNDHATKTEDRKLAAATEDSAGRHKGSSIVDRCRTTAVAGSSKLADPGPDSSGLANGGMDDDKPIAAVGN